ncbi:MAG TPA: MotA/TolQ/ExbB proton channel family protein [Usitatibacteraceae bacterium]|nr:MotA/TolQ/ExbB proton channel family protein [Usitatibacteraceae bacterium]
MFPFAVFYFKQFPIPEVNNMSFTKKFAAALVALVIAAMPFAVGVVGLQSTDALAQAPAAPADAAKPADAPKPPAAVPAVSKEVVENPYGLKAMLEHGDWVSKGVLAILVIMSMGSWYILVVKLFEQRRILKDATEANDSFFQAGNLSQGIQALKEDSAFRFIAESGVKATEHHEGGLTADIPLSEWVTMSVQRAAENVSNRLQDGLAFLATVGSTSPFVGLFGTVWGILNALTNIGIAGQASIDKVAGPVGEALIMTALGLAVAVPAVLSYNWLIRRNKVAMERVRSFSADLHGVLISQASKKR